MRNKRLLLKFDLMFFGSSGKYGGYELFKRFYTTQFPNANVNVVYLAASASAEFFADILLCPFEAVKVRMQTTLPPFAPNMRAGFSKIIKEEGFSGLYKVRYPLLQIKRRCGLEHSFLQSRLID